MDADRRPEFIAALRAEGLEPHAWWNGPGDRYAPHAHPYDKVLVCAAGSIVFGLPGGGERVELRPGDRLELAAGTEHDAAVGPHGVTCLEAHLPAGTLPATRKPRGPPGGRASRGGGRERVDGREAGDPPGICCAGLDRLAEPQEDPQG